MALSKRESTFAVVQYEIRNIWRLLLAHEALLYDDQVYDTWCTMSVNLKTQNDYQKMSKLDFPLWAA